LVKNQWCAAHNGTITMKAVKAMSNQQLIEEYEYICRRLEKDRLLSAQYNLFRPKPAISEPPSKRQRVERASSQPSNVPAATTQPADDHDSAGGSSFHPAGSAPPLSGSAAPTSAGGVFGVPDSTVPTSAAMDSAGSHRESGVSPFADSADSSSPSPVSTDHIPIDVLFESTSGGINEFFLDSDEDEQIGMSRVAADPDSDDEVLAEILFRGQYISGAGVVVVDKLSDDEIVDPRVKVETIPDSAASPPRSRRKHRGVRSDDSLWDKPVEDFFSSESESDDDMENYIPPLPYGAFQDWEMVICPLSNSYYHVYYQENRRRRYFTYLKQLLPYVYREDLLLLRRRMNRYFRLNPDVDVGLDLWRDVNLLCQSLHSDDVEDFWRTQDDWIVSSWKLYPKSSVHVLDLTNGKTVYMFVDKVYPIRATLLERMLRHRLTVPPSYCRDVVVAGNVIQTVQAGLRESYECLASVPIVDMVINPPWNLPFLGAKGLTSPEQTATGKGISNPLMAVMVCPKPYGIQLTNVSRVNTPGSDENRLKFFDLMYILVNGAVAAKSGSCCLEMLLKDILSEYRSSRQSFKAQNIDIPPRFVSRLLSLIVSFDLIQGNYKSFKAHEIEYPATIRVRSKLRLFQLFKDRLNEDRRTLFKTTCFGPWLDIIYVENDDGMIHYVLQKQCCSDDDNFDLPLIYHVNGHSLHFGRREFCLLTGFKFRLISFREYRNGDIPFRNRLSPEKIGYDVKIIDLFALFDDEEKFSKLSDEDAIRLCLLLSLEVIFMRRELVSVVDDVYLRMVNDLEAWNLFPWDMDIRVFLCNRWWTKVPEIIPRALSWRRKAEFNQYEYFGELFRKSTFYPSRVVEKQETLKKVVPQIEDYLQSTSEDEPDIKDHTSPKEDDGNVYCCDDNGDVPLFFMPAKPVSQQTDQDLSSDLSVLNGFCNLSQTGEEKGDCEHYKYTYSSKQEDQIIRLVDQRQQDHISNMAEVAEQKIQSEIQRLYNHREARLNKIAEEDKQRKCLGHMNSSAHMKLAIERCVPKKRKYVDVLRSPFCALPKISNVPSIEQLANQKNVLNPLMIEKCKSVKPWIEDLLRPFKRIDKIFLSHELQVFLSRAVVGRCKFPWCNDITVDRSFWNGLCALDDNRKGWLLDEHIDLWVTYLWLTQQTDMDWAMMRDCLEEKIPVVLKGTGVFEKKNIDPAKSGSSKLANGIPLAPDDPLQSYTCISGKN
ncbi:phospholipase-like protein, partial [Tanacetum coccineum]